MKEHNWISKYKELPPLKKSIIVKIIDGEFNYYKRTSDNFYKLCFDDRTVSENGFEFWAEVDLPEDPIEYQSSLDILLDKMGLDIKMQTWVTTEEFEPIKELESYFYIDTFTDEDEEFLTGQVSIKLEDEDTCILYNDQDVNNTLLFNIEDLRKIVAQYDKKEVELKDKRLKVED